VVKIVIASLTLLVPMLWELYLLNLVHFHPADSSNMGLPFVAWAKELHADTVNVWQASLPPGRSWTVWGVAASQLASSIALTLQAIFVITRFNWRNPLWIVGAAYAVLFFCPTCSVRRKTARAPFFR
jgi:hypothetical protein